MPFKDLVGAVVIGRNEGERLRACLTALAKNTSHIVYVDSGSTDGSQELASSMGVLVASLDMSRPFTAARARNTGFKMLTDTFPQIDFVQFIDGDCEIVNDWLDTAFNFLKTHPEYAVVCGRRREKFPDHSIYNLLCDFEWNTPVGETNACGGDALIRSQALSAIHGYRDDLIAGEEPEMCFRLRQIGWKIFRIDADMTFHDAAMTKFRQWWQRNKRAGFAFSQGSGLHGKSPEKYWVKETRSLIFWGGLLPLALICGGLLVNPWIHLTWLVYLLQAIKIAVKNPVDNNSFKGSFIYGIFVMLAKFPQFLGAVKYYSSVLLNQNSKIIEYK